ncbi:hypothetical protein AAFF_G00339110 [Aldrovandia affinis]|uniref:Uncharacterized protein n=1 Tax=Aldrovandia affinis TaxID=143900 RepID=A0AAD7SKE7_9TELE|nr:hypothetical protein AAFF_G00339110 [Aldrovandia affinis]
MSPRCPFPRGRSPAMALGAGVPRQPCHTWLRSWQGDGRQLVLSALIGQRGFPGNQRGCPPGGWRHGPPCAVPEVVQGGRGVVGAMGTFTFRDRQQCGVPNVRSTRCLCF